LPANVQNRGMVWTLKVNDGKNGDGDVQSCTNNDYAKDSMSDSGVEKSTRPARNRNTAVCIGNGMPSTTTLMPKLSIPSYKYAQIHAKLQVRI
jgi:hypothetical protein